MKIEVYSDGSATTADKPGGYGWVLLVNGQKVSEGNGHMAGATNNDAEMQGAIEGLSAAFKHGYEASKRLDPMFSSLVDSVTLVSDSNLVLGWVSGRYRFKQLAKIEQYTKLMKLAQRMDVKTRWVRGHSGDLHNERCDQLANAGRLKVSVDAPKKKKIKAIGHRLVGVVGLVSLDGRKKLVDLVHNVCQDYNETEHGLREVWIEVQEEVGQEGREETV